MNECSDSGGIRKYFLSRARKILLPFCRSFIVFLYLNIAGFKFSYYDVLNLDFFFSFFFSYGSGYDTLGQQQQGNAKDFSSNYSSNGQSKSTGGSAAAGTGKGEVPLMHF